MIYTINLTETENKAMEYIAFDVNEWIQNAVHERARIAIEEIIKITVEKLLENNQSIPSSKDEIVLLGFKNKYIKSSSEIINELESK